MANKLQANFEIVSDKSKNAVTSSEYIKHGNAWLNDAINAATTAVNSKADKSYVDAELAKKATTEALSTVDAKVNGKADATVVSQLQATVNTKADSSTVSALSERVSSTETGITAANSRIDEIVALPDGSTTADAELIDIRTKADGSKAASAGAAVREQVTDLKSDLGNDFIFDENCLVNTGYISVNGNPSGTTSENMYYYSNTISTHGIDSVTITKCGYKNVGSVIAFYTEDVISGTKFISGVSLPNALTEPLSVNVPQNAKFMVFSAYKSYGFGAFSSVSSVVKNISDTTSEIKNDVSEIKNDVSEIKNDVSEIKNDVSEEKILLDLSRDILTEKGYISVNGVAAPAQTDTYHYSDYIEVSTSTLNIESTVRNTGSIVAFYSADKTFISGVSYPVVLSEPLVVDVPSNARYMRFSAGYKTNSGGDVLFRVYTYTKDAVKKNYDDIKDIKSQASSIAETPKKIMSSLVLADTHKKIVLLGNSITQGVGSTGYISYMSGEYQIRGNGPDYPGAGESYIVGDFLYEQGNKKWYEATSGNGWSHLLKKYLESKFDCTVKNYGMSGISAYFLPLIIPTLTEGADIVIIMIGTNDRGRPNGRTELITNVRNSVIALRNEGKKVILMSSIPSSIQNETSENYVMHMEDVDHIYSALDSELGTEHISLYSEFINYCKYTGVTIDSLLGDGLHPNDAGYEVMFKIICDKIGLPFKRDGATW